MPRARTLLLLLGTAALAVGLNGRLAARHAPWTRPAGPTAALVLARLRSDGTLTLTHGPTAAGQRSLLVGPVRFRGLRAPENAAELERVLRGLRSLWAAPPRGTFDESPLTLEVAVDEDAPTAWLAWLLALAWDGDARLTQAALRRMPGGRLVPLQQMVWGEWEGPRPSQKEEPRTRVVLRRGRLPPKDDRLVLKVGRFKHHVGDEVEIEIEEDGVPPPPPRWRLEARLPGIAAWRTSAGRRRTAEVLGRVRALLREDLSHIDEVPLDVVLEPVYSRYADMPAGVVLDLLERLAGLPKTRLQLEAPTEGWR